MAKEVEKEAKKPRKKVSKKENLKEQPKKEVIKEEKKVEVKKEKKKSYNTKEVITIMILSMIIGLGVGSVITRHLCDKKHKYNLDVFDDVYSEIKENYYKPISKNDLLFSSLSGLIGGLNDRYASINDDKNAIINYEQAMEGSFVGIGITVCTNEEGKINIISIIDNSPASRNGLQAGDIIIKMDDVEYDVNNYSDFSYNISALGKGKEVELELLRDGETITKKIELDEVQIESVTYEEREINGKTIGLFRINNFAENTYDQFYDKYNEVKNKINGIILDVRCNSDGKIEIASKIASLFLDKDTVIFNYYRNGKYTEVLSENEKEIKLPTVVVVNGGTVNSGELLASALNENINTPIVGTKTFGKGLTQNMIELANGRTILYSTKEWVTSKKQKVEEVGIFPTVEVVCEEESCEYDIEINKAVEELASLF